MRIFGNGTLAQRGHSEKSEEQTRLRYDATEGPGAAERLYAGAVARRLEVLESVNETFKAQNRPRPAANAEKINLLKSQGLTAPEKLTLLQAATGKAPVAALPAIPPRPPIVAPVAAVAAIGTGKPVWTLEALAE